MAAIRKSTWFRTIGYKPHPKQVLYHRSKARFRAPICGRRFGKSNMSGKDAEPKLLDEKVRMWIVGPTYDLGEKEFRVIWDDLIIGRKLGRDRRVRKGYNKQQGNMFIEFPWQTRVEVRTADKPENLVGESLDHVIVSEAAKHKKETWERYLRPSLADKRGSADFPSTPEGQNWLHDVWKWGQNPNAQFKDYESWQFPSWENSAVYPGGYHDEEIELLRNTMTKEEFAQEIAADFTSFVGRIYSGFQESTHVQVVEYDPLLPNFIAFDFGFIAPFAAIEFQITPMDQVRIWREHYKTQLTVGEHIDFMKSREQPPGYKIDLCFGDPADPAAIQEICQKFAPCVGDPMVKENWREGVDLVASFVRLRAAPTQSIDEYGTPAPDVPGLVVDFGCEFTRNEFNNYKGKPSTVGRILGPQDLPAKINDHAMDAIRYALVHLYKLGANYRLGDAAVESDYGKAQLVQGSDLVLVSGAAVGALAPFFGPDANNYAPLWDFDGGPLDDDIYLDLGRMEF